MITRIRHLMLTAYDRTLSRFEDIIREQRERRNNPNWNFCHYFLLQVVQRSFKIFIFEISNLEKNLVSSTFSITKST